MAQAVLAASPYIRSRGCTILEIQLRKCFAEYATDELEKVQAWTLEDYLAWYIYHNMFHCAFHMPIPAISDYLTTTAPTFQHVTAFQAFVPGSNSPLDALDFLLTTTDSVYARRLNTLTRQLKRALTTLKNVAIPELQFLYDSQFCTYSGAS
jgi:hypothetical protein